MSPLERITEETLPPDLEEISRLMPDMPRGLGILRQTLALLPNPLAAFVRQSLPADELSAPGQASDQLAGDGPGMGSPNDLPPGTIQQQTPPRSPMNMRLALVDEDGSVAGHVLEVGPLVFNGTTFEDWARTLAGEWSATPGDPNGWFLTTPDASDSGVDAAVAFITQGGDVSGHQPYSRWPEERDSTGKPSGPYPWDDPTFVLETTFRPIVSSQLAFQWTDLKYYNPSGNWLDSILNVIVTTVGSVRDTFSRVVASGFGGNWIHGYDGFGTLGSVDGAQAAATAVGSPSYTYTAEQLPFPADFTDIDMTLEVKFLNVDAEGKGHFHLSFEARYGAGVSQYTDIHFHVSTGGDGYVGHPGGYIEIEDHQGGNPWDSPARFVDKNDWIANQVYKVRIQMLGADNSIRLKIWPIADFGASDPEPGTWLLDTTRAEAVPPFGAFVNLAIQNLSLFNASPGHPFDTYLDNLFIDSGAGDVRMDRGADSTYPDAVTPGDVATVGLELGSLYHLRVEFDKEVGQKAYVWLDGDPQPAAPTVELAHPFFRSPGHQPNPGQPSPLIHVGTSDGVTADYDTIDNAPYAPNGIRVLASGIDWTRMITEAPAQGAWRFTTVPEAGMDIAYQILGSEDA